MAVLGSANLYVVVRRDSSYRRMSDLKGARVGVDPNGSYGEVYARKVLAAYGVSDANTIFGHFNPEDMTKGLRDATLDAAMFVSGSLSFVQSANAATPIRILGIEHDTMNVLRGEFPFFKPFVLSAGEIAGTDEDIHTVGVDNILVCRGDLDEELIYQLTKALFSETEEGAPLGASLAAIAASEAPATPVPLHPGAARYYREREVQR